MQILKHTAALSSLGTGFIFCLGIFRCFVFPLFFNLKTVRNRTGGGNKNSFKKETALSSAFASYAQFLKSSAIACSLSLRLGATVLGASWDCFCCCWVLVVVGRFHSVCHVVVVADVGVRRRCERSSYRTFSPRIWRATLSCCASWTLALKPIGRWVVCVWQCWALMCWAPKILSGRGVRVANPQNFILGWATLLQYGLVGTFRGFSEFQNIASDIPVGRLIGETRKSQVFVMFANPKVKCACKFKTYVYVTEKYLHDKC